MHSILQRSKKKACRSRIASCIKSMGSLTETQPTYLCFKQHAVISIALLTGIINSPAVYSCPLQQGGHKTLLSQTLPTQKPSTSSCATGAALLKGHWSRAAGNTWLIHSPVLLTLELAFSEHFNSFQLWKDHVMTILIIIIDYLWCPIS